MLAVNMLVISIFGSYQTAQAAEIVAGYTIGQILESILLSFGISIFTTEMIQKGTSATWWDTDGSAALKPYYDDLEQAYEEQRFKVINGGGGQNPEPSPTPAPGTTPIPFPTTVPVPGDIPTFRELVAPALAGTAAFINMTQGAWECMGEAVSSLWDKFVNNKTVVQDDYIPDWDSDYFVTTSGTFKQVGKAVSFCPLGGSNPYGVAYSYFTIYASPDATSLKLKKGDYYDEFKDNLGKILVTRYDVSYYNTGQTETKKLNNQSFLRLYSPVIGSGYGYSFSSDLPVYVDDSDEPLSRNDGKEMIWVHPDLQNTYQNNGKLEYPQQAPQPLQIPSGDQLADLSKKLNPEINTDFSPEMAPNYIAELIQQLQKGLNPDPDPDPNPNPNPNPDPNPDPNPNPTGSLDPEPTKAPEEDSSNDIDPKNYTTDLKRIFPFCIPFDLVHLIQAFEAEPEAPVFEIPFDLELEDPWTGKKIVNYHHTFKLDFSDYESVIEIFRIFEVIFFIIGLLLITRQQMIKG